MAMLELMEQLKREAIEGGELLNLPCPLCGKPRSQRSDYIRCTPCAANWMEGEDLSKDPRLSRKSGALNLVTRSLKAETDTTA